eukprot:sb/3475855/
MKQLAYATRPSDLGGVENARTRDLQRMSNETENRPKMRQAQHRLPSPVKCMEARHCVETRTIVTRILVLRRALRRAFWFCDAHCDAHFGEPVTSLFENNPYSNGYCSAPLSPINFSQKQQGR